MGIFDNQVAYTPLQTMQANPMPLLGGNPLATPEVAPGSYGYIRPMGPQATTQSIIPNSLLPASGLQALDFSGVDLGLAGTDRTWMQRFGDGLVDSGFLGKTDTTTGMQTQGWGGLALGGLQGLGNLYMGMKQYGLAKDQLAFQKDSFNKNFAVQKQLTNSQLEDRQRARVASNAGAYQSVGDYMKQNGVA